MKGTIKKNTMTEQQSREEQAYLNGVKAERKRILDLVDKLKIPIGESVTLFIVASDLKRLIENKP